MRRGEVRWVQLDAGGVRRSHAMRPAVIVSNDGANTAAARRGSGVITVVPLSSSERPAHPFQVVIPAGTAGIPRDAKALAEQVRTVSAQRIGPSIGMLDWETMRRVDAALRVHLGL